MTQPPVDCIRLTGLAADGRHGVYDFEREQGQRFVVDVALWGDLAEAAASDDVGDTVNYADLAAGIVEIIQGGPVNLIETLAGRVVDLCLSYSRVTWVEVCVHKPAAPLLYEFADVSVTLQRGSVPPCR